LIFPILLYLLIQEHDNTLQSKMSGRAGNLLWNAYGTQNAWRLYMRQHSCKTLCPNCKVQWHVKLLGSARRQKKKCIPAPSLPSSVFVDLVLVVLCV
jgi:hypothetical protein